MVMDYWRKDGQRTRAGAPGRSPSKHPAALRKRQMLVRHLKGAFKRRPGHRPLRHGVNARAQSSLRRPHAFGRGAVALSHARVTSAFFRVEARLHEWTVCGLSASVLGIRGAVAVAPLQMGERLARAGQCGRGRGQGAREVVGWPYTVGGAPPPPPQTLLPWKCLRLTANILLRRLRCQEDLRFKHFGPPSAGTRGGPWEEGTPPPPHQSDHRGSK